MPSMWIIILSTLLSFYTISGAIIAKNAQIQRGPLITLHINDDVLDVLSNDQANSS